MAQLRIIGDPTEVDAVLDALRAVATVSDVSRRGSRYSATDVRVYAHVTPVSTTPTITIVFEQTTPANKAAGGHVLPPARRALPPHDA